LQSLRADFLWTNRYGSFPAGRNLKGIGSPETTSRLQHTTEMGVSASLK
jgi:hypothetical protein